MLIAFPPCDFGAFCRKSLRTKSIFVTTLSKLGAACALPFVILHNSIAQLHIAEIEH